MSIEPANKILILPLLLLTAGPSLSAEEWYQGGDLHGSTLKEWSNAEERNKLATASDYLVIVLGESQIVDVAAFKARAETVVDCVDTLIPVFGKSYDIEKEKANSVAFFCINQLESNDWK